VSQRFPLPPAMVKRASEFAGEPVPARPAATVVLLRPADAGFEVYVLRRAASMAAFGGVYAFPGGGVDPADRPETLGDDWADRLGVPQEQAKAVVGAAARELFEEAGVLLAGPDGAIGDLSGDDWEADRLAVQERTLAMTELLEQRGLRLRDDLLLPWARWITPEFEPRRFDTWFFVALLPAGQTARDVSGEADRTAWVSPAGADGLTMLPPTRSMLEDLRAYEKIEEVVAAASGRDAAAPVLPGVETDEDGRVFLLVPQPKRPVM
jgi:8-oxo-dGTP pyrophosphatase MutT (NUDIX family)